MTDPIRESTAQATVLPDKRFLSNEDLLEIWETRGLKFRVDEFYTYCTNRGLMAHFRKDSFRAKMFGMLKQFFVDGESRRDPSTLPPTKTRKVF